MKGYGYTSTHPLDLSGLLWGEPLPFTYITEEYRVFVGKHDGKRHLEDLGVDGRIMLKRIFKQWEGEAWTGLISLRMGTGGCLL